MINTLDRYSQERNEVDPGAMKAHPCPLVSVLFIESRTREAQVWELCPLDPPCL